jgi:HEAT repeat protein
LAAGGCADFAPSWNPFASRDARQLAKLPTPAKQMKALDKLGSEASSMSPEQQQQTAADLGQKMQTETDALMRAQLVRTSAHFGAPAADATLLKGLSDSDRDVRIVACQACGKRKDPAMVVRLSEVLSGDTDLDVRMAAATALGETGDPEATKALGLALEDNNPALQFRVVQSLSQVTGKTYGNDVAAWRDYVQGREPHPREVSVAERFWQLF